MCPAVELLNVQEQWHKTLAEHYNNCRPRPIIKEVALSLQGPIHRTD